MSDKYESLRLKNQLCFPLYLCAKEVVRRYGPLLDRINLTYTQYIVMMYFWERRSSNVKEASDALLLDPSTLTPILKKLEQKGYLTRTRSASDERNLVVALTDAGEALQDEALAVPAQMKQCLCLTEEEGRTLYALVSKILSNIEKES